MKGKELEIVYVYIEPETGEVVYVGRAKSLRRFVARVDDHTRDRWGRGKRFEIRYIGVETRALSEALETDLINIYNPKYNVAKKGWGLTYEIGKMHDITKYNVMTQHMYEDRHWYYENLEDKEWTPAN